MSFTKARNIFLARVKDLRLMCQSGSPFVFLCACAMLEYLSKLVCGRNERRQGYKKLIRIYLKKEYEDFKYKSGKQDLPEQMYHVLRCGIVHSYSLVPDNQAISEGGRPRPIVLCHKKEARKRKWKHLESYSTRAIPDAAIFIAEDFVDDIQKCIDLIFKDKSLKENIKQWIKAHPPITGGF